MAEHDYSDSDDEERVPRPSAASRPDTAPASAPPSSAAPKSSGPRVKLTFRPNLTHLMNDDPPAEGSQPPLRSDRSSLSPPPPLTLKLGRAPHRPIDRANYSDSSDDDAHSTLTNNTSTTNPKRPAKKPKVDSSSPGKKTIASEGASKKYDWLAPSAIGASHHGPPERTGAASPTLPSEKDGRRLSGWAPGEDYVTQVTADTKKKSRPDKPPGLGKAWRKGIKKGMPMPTREDFSGANTPGEATPTNHLSPEPQDPSAPAMPRAPSPPFVKAEPSILGIPVFKRPIVPPKINLTTFPKVSPVFSPINGGDVGPFPRKEPVRRWKMKERVLVGIGGSPLRFTTWAKDGPPSELSRLVRADKEARELALKKAKAAGGERPPLTSTLSSDSTPTSSNLAISLVPEEAKEETMSEIGDGEESVASLTFDNGTAATSSVAGTPPPGGAGGTGGGVPKRKPIKGPSKPKAGPRKSKLAQEIKVGSDVGSASDAIEDIM